MGGKMWGRQLGVKLI